MALTEAVAHLEAGLGVIGNLPASEARDRSELECRVLLGTAWEAYRGWPAPQLAEVLKPALPLARAARQPKLLAPTLWGLWVQMMSVGPVAESLFWAEELLSAGEDLADEELLLVGHMAVMVTNFWLGNPLVVERHARAILKRYVQERHGQIVKSVNHAGSITVQVECAAVLLSYRSCYSGSDDWKSIQQRVPIRLTACHLGGVRPWFVCSVYSDVAGTGLSTIPIAPPGTDRHWDRPRHRGTD